MVRKALLLFHVLCVSASVWAEVPFEMVPIKVVSGLEETMESLTASSKCLNAQRRKEVQNIQPYIGCLTTLLPKLEIDINVALNALKEVHPKTDDRSPSGEQLKTSLQTISQVIATLNETDLTRQRKTEIVHLLHDHVEELVNHFDHVHATFRQYPLLALRPILSITSFVATFYPVMKISFPELAKESRLSCRINEVLLEYRSLAVQARLEQISVDVADEAPELVLLAQLQMKNIMVDVIREKYNRSGYSNSSGYRCDTLSSSSSSEESEDDDVTLIDHVNLRAIPSRQLDDDSWQNCFRDYMQMTRFTTETSFDAAINLVRDIKCPPRLQTGAGWMITTIQRVVSNDEELCDNLSPCDPYVKIYRNVNLLYISGVVEDNPIAVFMETYTSGKMDGNESIRMEVWDADNFLNGADDQILSVTRAARSFGENDEDSSNGIHLQTSTVWKPEYSLPIYQTQEWHDRFTPRN